MLFSNIHKVSLVYGLLLILILPALFVVSTQSSVPKSKSDSNNIYLKSPHVDLQEHAGQTNVFNRISPKINAINNLTSIEKTSSTYFLNQIETFWVEDIGKASDGIDNNGNGKDFSQGDWAEAMYQINATVVNITENSYIFVDSAIASNYEGGLGSEIGQEFETYIQPADTKLGTPSDIDNNSRIIILIFAFREGNLHPGYYTTGYFWPLHMHKPSTDPTNIYYYSEYKEIIQVNDLAIRGSGKTVQDWAPTIAHEYFHLIHYKYNPNETLWMEEGLAVLAENLAGYKQGYISYLQDPSQNGYFLHAYDRSLTYFSQTLESYGQSFLFMQYLYQRFGLKFIQDLVQTNLSGMNAIQHEITNLNSSLKFMQVYSDWMIATLVNDQTNSTYSYLNFSYRISESQYDVTNKLKIVPFQFNDQIIPYWSNEFFLLPQNNLKPYLLTFQPELLSNSSFYQLTIITFYNSSFWNYEKIPLVNDQSGSFSVQYNNTGNKKVLIISSLVGNSSEGNSITQATIYSSYYSTYNLYLYPYIYKPVFNLISTNKSLPSYYVDFYTSSNTLLSENYFSNITIDVYAYGELANSPVLESSISIEKTSQKWFINSEIFQNLPDGQYYFTLTLKASNQTTVKGLTFLLIRTNENSSIDLLVPIVVTTGVIIAIPSTIIMVKKRKKQV